MYSENPITMIVIYTYVYQQFLLSNFFFCIDNIIGFALETVIQVLLSNLFLLLLSCTVH